jgi:hypothetical protein
LQLRSVPKNDPMARQVRWIRVESQEQWRMSYEFQLGQVFSSPAARASLTQDQLVWVLKRHVSGVWDADCRNAKEQAVLNRPRIFSTFLIAGNQGQRVTIWIVTEENHTRTLVMLPRESAYRASDLEEVRESPLHLWRA